MAHAALRRPFAAFALPFLAAVPLAAPLSAAASPAKAAVVALALWSDPVFRSEAEGAAKVLAKRYGHGGPVVVRFNTPSAMVNGPAGIAAALKLAARGVDPARDVLILLLTTHGSPEGMADKGGGRIGLVTPDALKGILDASPFRHRVVIVSACYAGTYTALASPDTLVMTAADSTHPSFGCRPEAHWTYFGDALFDRALRRDASLPAAFADARAIVAAPGSRAGPRPVEPADGRAAKPCCRCSTAWPGDSRPGPFAFHRGFHASIYSAVPTPRRGVPHAVPAGTSGRPSGPEKVELDVPVARPVSRTRAERLRRRFDQGVCAASTRCASAPACISATRTTVPASTI